MSKNPHKTVCANSDGIITSFRDTNKHKFIAYDHTPLTERQRYAPERSIQRIVAPRLSPVQQKLYAEHVYGLNYYTPEQVAAMRPTEKYRIMHMYKKVQRVLNVWKQEIVHKRADAFMNALFPKSNITKTFLATQGTDSALFEMHTFKELGITQAMIAEKLVSVGLLPANFFQLA